MRLAADNCTLKERADLAGSSGEALVETFVSEHYAASAQSSDFIAPPYDEISWDRRRYLANRSCYSIVHVLLPEGKDDKCEAESARASLMTFSSGHFDLRFHVQSGSI